MQGIPGLVKTPAKPIKTDFPELSRVHDLYQVSGSKRSLSDIRHEIRKYPEEVAVLICGQPVDNFIAVKLVTYRRSACGQGTARWCQPSAFITKCPVRPAFGANPIQKRAIDIFATIFRATADPLTDCAVRRTDICNLLPDSHLEISIFC
jgi:hypothetical protein